MDDQELSAVQNIVIERWFDKNVTIFSENEEADGFFFVDSGQVKIFKLSPEGKEHVLHICLSGETFAEAAMFSGKVYPAYAKAIKNSNLLFFPKKGFLELIKKDPTLSFKIMASLSIKLRKFADMIEDLSLKEVSARLAKYILDLSIHAGSRTVNLDIKKTDLALKLGTVGETLSRTLKKLKDNKIINASKNQITILDLDSLQQISSGMKI